MTNFKSDHNGYYKLPVDQLKLITCNDFLNSSSILSGFKKQFPCNICFILLFIIQISSTCLMLISVAFTFKMISAENQFVNQSTKAIKQLILNSGNDHKNNIESNRDFFQIFLRRSRSLSIENPTDSTLILTKDIIKSICKDNSLSNKFKYLSRVKLSYCDIFNISSVIYSLLITESDMRDILSNITFPIPSYPVTFSDNFLNEIPSQLLIMLENGSIFTSKKSVHESISDHFLTEDKCTKVLNNLLDKDNEIKDNVKSFDETLLKNHCERSSGIRNTSVIFCDDCRKAYKKWLCTQKFDLFISIILPKYDNESLNKISKSQSALISIKSCPQWCSTVEKECPYFTPVEGNGGEPAFLCDESHYHHNARYRVNIKSQCGVDMPWTYCCYSERLLQETQLISNNSLYSDSNSDMSSELCVTHQRKCLNKLITSVYVAKNSTSINNSNYFHTNNAVSIFTGLNRFQLQLIIYCISSSLFLYFYTHFSIR